MISIWDEIEVITKLPHVAPTTIAAFAKLRRAQSLYTRGDGATIHLCSFAVPYDRGAGRIYLGHHIKANAWIPPGGHLEPGEIPSVAALRECEEELGYHASREDLEPWDLSVSEIIPARPACNWHYDVWYLVHMSERNLTPDKSEFYSAGWFSLEEAVAKTAQNPQFSAILVKL